jgi:hypothetical protein
MIAAAAPFGASNAGTLWFSRTPPRQAGGRV